MENWGLITYRTTALLLDDSSGAHYRKRCTYVVAHGKGSLFGSCLLLMMSLELAHQWFGNFVTMDWWNELWLNEGFATWMGYVAVNHLHPGKLDLLEYFVEGCLH